MHLVRVRVRVRVGVRVRVRVRVRVVRVRVRVGLVHRRVPVVIEQRQVEPDALQPSAHVAVLGDVRLRTPLHGVATVRVARVHVRQPTVHEVLAHGQLPLPHCPV